MKHSIIITLAAIMLIACGVSSNTGINKSIFVADGEHKTVSLRSVNGVISVGNEVTIEGNCTTVNGKISIGENSQVGEISCVNGSIYVDRNSKADEVSCVNGSIDLGSEVEIAGDVSTVNGSIQCSREVEIVGDLGTVNGDMETKQSLIGGNISTVNGDIDLLESSLVKGDIIINRDQKKPLMKAYKELIITIASSSKVEGDIKVKGDDPNVTVILSGDGEVLGEIINAKVIRK